MRTAILSAIGLLLTSPSLAPGQPNSITISASRTLYIAPDQILFSVSVTTPISTSLDDVVSSLASLGVTLTDLQSVQSLYRAPMLTWSFQLSVPFATLGATSDSLTNFQKAHSAMRLTFNLNGTQVSANALAAQPCPYTDLIADAQSQARSITAATGATVGPILALSYGTPQSTPTALSFTFIPIATFLLGASPQPQAVPCSIAVKFELK